MKYSLVNEYKIFRTDNNFNDLCMSVLGLSVLDYDLEEQDADNKTLKISIVVSEKEQSNSNFFYQVNQNFGKYGDKTEYVILMKHYDYLFDYNDDTLIEKFIEEYKKGLTNEEVVDGWVCPF